MRKRTVWLKLMVVVFFFILSRGAGAFEQADLRKFVETNSCANCDLSGADLSGDHFVNADLRKANLRGADLSRSSFQGSDFNGANLQGANFFEANLNNADLSNTYLYHVNFSGATIDGVNFNNSFLYKARWINTNNCKKPSIGECNQ